MKVGVYTLGCKVNTYESEYIINELKKRGYEVVPFDSVCDVYIINTCTVTNNSDSKSRKIIRQARRSNKDAIVVAMGCFVEANKDVILDLMPEIDIAIGTKDKTRTIDLFEAFMKDHKRINDTSNESDNKFEDMYIEEYNTRTRAFVKVQDGCENFCSYCIIPHVRGKCRSKDLNTCVEEIKSLVNNGFKEIVLTGIHTGNYGTDIGTNFAALLKELIKIDGLLRIRISSIEATELTPEVLEVIKNSPKIVNHFHVPIQSGSNKVLKLMNRKYNVEEFIKKIEELRSIKEDVSITTDIITGHPGEDDDEFEEVIDTLERIKFSKLHVFPYSIRKGTPSSRLPQVSDDTKKRHTDKLLSLSNIYEREFMEKFVGRRVEVLIETSKDGFSYGHTTNYLHVKIDKELEHNTLVLVEIEKVDYPYVIGHVCK